MGVDKKTQPNWVNIVIDESPAYLKQLEKQADADDQNTADEIKVRGCKRISLTMDNHEFEPSEFYFDEGDNTIFMSGTLKSDKGESWISLSMPLSEEVLIDIINYALKKLNKLKAAMEALK